MLLPTYQAPQMLQLENLAQVRLRKPTPLMQQKVHWVQPLKECRQQLMHLQEKVQQAYRYCPPQQLPQLLLAQQAQALLPPPL
jgi:hypothetical protein